jgi:hypothetical protein
MDSPNDMVVRRWLLSIGTAETALVLALLLVLLLYRRDFIEAECYSRVLLGLGVAGVMKGVVWGVAAIILFTTRISKHCMRKIREDKRLISCAEDSAHHCLKVAHYVLFRGIKESG